jgi:hypothetical protein
MSLRLSCSLLAVGLFVAVPDCVCADDDLSKFVEQNRLLAQKVKTEASHAMAQARVLEKADPEQAQVILQRALKQVQNSTALSANEQTQLSGQLLSRLRDVGEVMRQQKVAQQQAPLRELPRKANDNPGSGSAAIAQKFIDKSNAGLDASARISEDKNRGFSSTVNSVASSSVPPTGDVMFPKDWAAKNKLREKYGAPVLSAKEVALVKALNSVLSVDYQEKPFKDVLEDLQKRTGQAIIVDEASRKESNTDYSDPVSLKLNKVLFRTVLRKVLADQGLTFVVQEGTIQVVTTAKAREMMTTRTYPISDLVAPSGFANQFGPFIARAQMLNNVQTMISMIQNSVDPTIWQQNGGNGSVQFYEPGMALIIRAPTEFHYQLAGGGLFGSGSR